MHKIMARSRDFFLSPVLAAAVKTRTTASDLLTRFQHSALRKTSRRLPHRGR
jgi:hypothetical protein